MPRKGVTINNLLINYLAGPEIRSPFKNKAGLSTNKGRGLRPGLAGLTRDLTCLKHTNLEPEKACGLSFRPEPGLSRALGKPPALKAPGLSRALGKPPALKAPGPNRALGKPPALKAPGLSWAPGKPPGPQSSRPEPGLKEVLPTWGWAGVWGEGLWSAGWWVVGVGQGAVWPTQFPIKFSM